MTLEKISLRWDSESPRLFWKTTIVHGARRQISLATLCAGSVAPDLHAGIFEHLISQKPFLPLQAHTGEIAVRGASCRSATNANKRVNDISLV